MTDSYAENGARAASSPVRPRPGPDSRPAAGCSPGFFVAGRQPGEFRVDLADHSPDDSHPCLELGRIRVRAVGLEPVDGLRHAPERVPLTRTHRRIVAVRRRSRRRFRMPQLWIAAVDFQTINSGRSFSSAQPVDRIYAASGHGPVIPAAISTTISPACAQRDRRVCTPCPHHPPPVGSRSAWRLGTMSEPKCQSHRLQRCQAKTRVCSFRVHTQCRRGTGERRRACSEGR